MTEINIDPELRDDRDEVVGIEEEVELPDYDPTQFELPDDFEYLDEEDIEEEDE